ncbi:MAG: hypothetical protein ACWA5R_13000 [bacterium]
MSTTFDIYPGEAGIPTFKEVFERCTKEYHSYLKDVGIQRKPQIEAQILTNEGNKKVIFNINDPFKWDEDHYLWVQVKGIAGGTDGYFWQNDQSDYDYWNEDIIPMDRCLPIRELLEECISHGYHWNFRRSAGQPGVINILYGILSGTLAAMTKGIVFSDDTAWDYERMPIKGAEFLENYYRPKKELNEDTKNEAISSIKWATEELEEINA